MKFRQYLLSFIVLLFVLFTAVAFAYDSPSHPLSQIIVDVALDMKGFTLLGVDWSGTDTTNLDADTLDGKDWDDVDLTTGSSPIGSVIAWLKSYPNTPALPAGWVECNGSVLNDAESVYDGQIIPNLNGRFLRGNAVSGGIGGSTTHNHGFTPAYDGYLAYSSVSSPAYMDAANHLPPYYGVVWIMKVK